jgi:putative sigma-54 modulation protein
MKTQIQSIHFDADKKLQDFIYDKTDELFEVYNRIENCDVILKMDKDNKNKDKVVEINMNIPGNRLFVKNHAETFEIAFEMAINEIKKQLAKQKEKSSARNNLGVEILE